MVIALKVYRLSAGKSQAMALADNTGSPTAGFACKLQTE
jgi:hypothetical protein